MYKLIALDLDGTLTDKDGKSLANNKLVMQDKKIDEMIRILEMLLK